MGIEPFLIASSVNLIMAQRLARSICSKCREPYELPAQALIDLGVPAEEAQPIQTWKGKGCSHCGDTGYRGRTALYEVMRVTDELRELILAGGTAAELKQQAIDDGMVTLRQAGITKISSGETTLEEVLRVTMAD